MTIVAIVLISLFVILAITHLVLAFYRIALKRGGHSSVPVINCVLGSVGLALLPDPDVARWWWIAWLLDWGGVPLLLEHVVAWALRPRSSIPPA